jgi:hypothetical protein
VSTYEALVQVSTHVKNLLWDGLKGMPEGDWFSTSNKVSLESPASLLGATNATTQSSLSWYLYQVAPNPYVNTGPLLRHGDDQRHRPLSLDLHYLLTPLLGVPDSDQYILGRAMQILAANPCIVSGDFDSDLRPAKPEIHVRINPCTLEELTRIWHAFNQAYRLSVCYQVQVVSIDSLRVPEDGTPVLERLLDVHRMSVDGG